MPASQPRVRPRITISAHQGRIIVRADRNPIADTLRALVLKEGTYPPVIYVPRDDIDMTQLEANDIHSHCPHKGEASYFNLASEGYRSAHIGWSYEQPHEAVAAIAGHIAFYPDRLISIEGVKPAGQPS
jgi:uncharacterized protein (DUF427 family)